MKAESAPAADARQSVKDAEIAEAANIKPLWLAKQIVKRPCIFMLGCIFVMFVLAAAGMSKFHINTKPPRGRSAYALNDDYRTIRLDAYIKAQEANSIVVLNQTTQSDSDPTVPVLVLWKTKDKTNLLTLDRVNKIREVEQKIKALSDLPIVCHRCPNGTTPYANSPGMQLPAPGCLPCMSAATAGCGPSGPGCSPFMSFTNFLFPTTTAGGATVNDGNGTTPLTQMALDEAVKYLAQPTMRSITNPLGSSFYFEKEFNNVSTAAFAVRSLIKFALPLPGYLNSDDRQLEQLDKVGAVQVEIKKLLEAEMVGAEAMGLELMYLGGPIMIDAIIMETLSNDGTFAVGAMFVVFLFVWFHTGSAFLGAFGMFHIVMSLPIAICLTINVFQIRYFDMLNMFILFVVMGIGADDVFVFHDAWKQSSRMGSVILSDPVLRLSYVMRRSSKAMFVTSATTTLAFVANATSTLMPTSAFGVFAALVIVTNFLLVITYFPAVVVVHSKTFEGNACCPPPCLLPKTYEPDRDSQEMTGEKSSRLEDLMNGPVLAVVLKRRLILVVFFLCVAATGAALAAQMEADQEEPRIFPDDHMFTRLVTTQSDDFASSNEDALTRADVVYGLQPSINREGHTMYDFGSSECGDGPCGKHTYDPLFSLSSPEEQGFMLAMCQLDPVTLPGCTRVSKEHTCLMQDFSDFRNQSGKAFPVVNASEFKEDMSIFLADQSGTSGGPYAKYVKSKRVHWDAKQGRFAYYSVSREINFNPILFYTMAQVEKCEKDWNAWVDTQNAAAPPGLARGYFTTSTQHGFFVRIFTADQFTVNAVNGLLIALSLAFVVLMLSTLNLIVGLVAFACIGAVVSSTVGTMFLIGWKVGVVESICLSLVVGFSVDFIVHYANSYVESPESLISREEKTTRAMTEMGISILGGGLTTLLASLFLFGTTLQFFYKFGVFMMITVSFSLVYANFFFLPLLALVGPQGDTGNLRRLCRASTKVAVAPVEA
jgi:hypothetical protein